MRQFNERASAIDGKSMDPLVLAAYAELFDIASLKQVDDIVAAIPWLGSGQLAGHTLLSEIASARIADGTAELVTLERVPVCINGFIVSQIAGRLAAPCSALA
ncbi:MAG: hypothetical protein V9G14_13580 [Cypionkella sp.]